MPYFVRPRNNGRTFELRVKHCRLPKPVYRNLDLQEDAQRAGRDAIAALDRGEIPSWFERSERRALVTVAQAIVAYRGIRAVPPSTQLLLDILINDVGNRPLVDVNYTWAEAWIRAMKLERQLLATPGEGVETERWQDVRDRPVWLDYQLCRHNDAGEVRWTWRRTSVEMTQLYAELGEDLVRRRYDQVARTLQRIANQPGFHGVRAQSKALFEFATARGYSGPLPPLFFVQKIAHGKPMAIV